jgi:hypothetical protein
MEIQMAVEVEWVEEVVAEEETLTERMDHKIKLIVLIAVIKSNDITFFISQVI